MLATCTLKKSKVGLLLACVIGILACGNRSNDLQPAAKRGSDSSRVLHEFKRTQPPFTVRGELRDLLLTWFDEKGMHTAQSRAEIPSACRKTVRLDTTSLTPKQRDPNWVWVGDLRQADQDGNYAVYRVPRDVFSTWAEAKQPAKPAEDVIIYSASWCGACKSAKKFFAQRNIAFIDKDVEKVPTAAAEMKRKAQKAGVPYTGLPVIDFQGKIMAGFDPGQLEKLIQKSQHM